MGNCISEKHSHLFTSNTGLNAAVSGMQGWRPNMEDAHLVADIKSRPDHTLLAIFDGHGGTGAANYASENLLDCLENTTQWQNYLLTNATNLDLLQEALKQSFLDLDRQLRFDRETNEENYDSSGCTANVIIVTPTHYICANVGDSRSILSIKDSLSSSTTTTTTSSTNTTSTPAVIELSHDHKPSHENELRRIEAAGGTVHMKRIDGDLAVSRALGDFAYKQNKNLSPDKQKVSSVPDIIIHPRHFIVDNNNNSSTSTNTNNLSLHSSSSDTCTELTTTTAPQSLLPSSSPNSSSSSSSSNNQSQSHDEFIIMACDGLWDVLTNEEAIAHVRRLLSLGETSLVLIVEEMIDIALDKGSRDNISVILIQLPGLTFSPPSGITNSTKYGVKKLREIRGNKNNKNQRLQTSLDGDEHSG